MSLANMPLLVWGLLQLHMWPTAMGTVLVYAGKIWFLDRMVWLYQDLCAESTEYESWLY